MTSTAPHPGRCGQARDDDRRAAAILLQGRDILVEGDEAPAPRLRHAAAGVAAGTQAQGRVLGIARIAVGAQPLFDYET